MQRPSITSNWAARHSELLGVCTSVLLTLGTWGCSGPTSRDDASTTPVKRTAAERNALAARFQARLDELWQAAQSSEENFPGGTAAYILPDGEIFAFATGYSDVEAELQMEPDLRMPSGSIGKTYVAAVALELAMRGELELDAKISQWIGDEPWFSRLPNHEDLTLRILLTHTGGLIDHAFDSAEFHAWAKSTVQEGNDTYLKPAELVAFALDKEPLFPVGEGFSYTDTGYILAGLAIETATGRSYYDLLRELVLEPFSFEFTLPADRPDLPGLAQGYAHEGSKIFGTPLRMVEDGRMVLNPHLEWTGGGLVNNPQDLARFAKLLYEGEAIQGDDLPQLLAIGFVEDAEQPTTGYALGTFLWETEHGAMYGHSGFFPGYNSAMVYYPDYEIAIALQINSDSTQIREHIKALSEIVLASMPQQDQQKEAA